MAAPSRRPVVQRGAQGGEGGASHLRELALGGEAVGLLLGAEAFEQHVDALSGLEPLQQLGR